jgi:hypothetical protein
MNDGIVLGFLIGVMLTIAVIRLSNAVAEYVARRKP